MTGHSFNQQSLTTSTDPLLLSDHREAQVRLHMRLQKKRSHKNNLNLHFFSLVADQFYNYAKVLVLVKVLGFFSC